MEKQKGPRLRHITLRVPRDDFYLLQRIADSRKLSVSEFVQYLVNLHLMSFKL